jgi:tellurite resistance protein TerC
MLTHLVAHWHRLRKFWYTNARKIVIGAVGGSIILLGILSEVTPAPSTLLLCLGFAVLANEFVWAKRFLKHAKAFLKKKLPDKHANRIDRLFAWVARHSKRIANWLHVNLVKPLTPRRKHVKLVDPTTIVEPVKDPLP